MAYLGNSPANALFNLSPPVTLSAGQTAVNINYTPGRTLFLLNGAVQTLNDDITATNGSTVTLTNAANAGDQLVAINFASFAVANALPLSGGALSGPATMPTPAQFDSSTQLATTGFVQRAIGSFQNYYYYGASQALTAAQVGSVIEMGGGGTTVTLPPLSSVPVGGCYVLNSIATTPVTVVPSGSDTVDGVGTVGNSSSFSLVYNDMVWVMSLGSKWHAMGSGAAMFANNLSNGMFGSSLYAAGFQKLPSGLVLQWGDVTTSSGGAVALTFPMAFPNAYIGGLATITAQYTTALPAISLASKTGMTITTQNYPTSAGGAASMKYLAWGY